MRRGHRGARAPWPGRGQGTVPGTPPCPGRGAQTFHRGRGARGSGPRPGRPCTPRLSTTATACREVWALGIRPGGLVTMAMIPAHHASSPARRAAPPCSRGDRAHEAYWSAELVLRGPGHDQSLAQGPNDPSRSQGPGDSDPRAVPVVPTCRRGPGVHRRGGNAYKRENLPGSGVYWRPPEMARRSL